MHTDTTGLTPGLCSARPLPPITLTLCQEASGRVIMTSVYSPYRWTPTSPSVLPFLPIRLQKCTAPLRLQMVLKFCRVPLLIAAFRLNTHTDYKGCVFPLCLMDFVVYLCLTPLCPISLLFFLSPVGRSSSKQLLLRVGEWPSLFCSGGLHTHIQQVWWVTMCTVLLVEMIEQSFRWAYLLLLGIWHYFVLFSASLFLTNWSWNQLNYNYYMENFKTCLA